MHYTQNDKIRQATEGTIVVGVDIGSEKNYARAFKGNGIEITRKAFYFPNTLEGFKIFEEMVTKLTVALAEKKIVVGVEPTGHYWFNFADYCQEKQMTVVTVAPQHVKHSKEMDDNTQRKDDRKDPRVIAKLVIEGRYCIPYTGFKGTDPVRSILHAGSADILRSGNRTDQGELLLNRKSERNGQPLMK